MSDERTIEVLIVDDSPEDTAQYLRCLRGWPGQAVTIRSAELGDEAAEILTTMTPDVILLDYQLPDTTGLEFLSEIRPNCAVIMLTGVGDEDVAVQAMRAGAQDYLVKGRLTPDLLRRAVQGAVATYDLHRELDRSRRQTTLILQSVTDGFLRVDRQLTVLALNPAASALLGAPETLVGRPLTDLPWITGSPLIAALASDSDSALDLNIPAGRCVRVRLYPSQDGVTAYLYDVTDTREAEERQRAHSAQLHRLYGVASALNAARTRQEVCRAAHETGPALLDALSVDLLPDCDLPDLPPDAARAAQLALQTGQDPAPTPPWLIVALPHTRGALCLQFAPGTQRTDDDQTITSTFAQLIVNALTRAALVDQEREYRATLEDRVSQRTAELRRSNRDLEQFAHVASHDLKEPLRTISSFTQLLQSRYGSQLDDRARRYMDLTVEGAQRMATLIDDVLAVSRLHAARGTLTLTDLRELALGVVTQLGALQSETGGGVHVGELPSLTVDPTQFGQLFQNLIGNALKFHRPGVAPCVQVSAQPSSEGWQFTVQDNGVGIAAEYHERVFVIFQRLHTRDHYTGNGIGLALCQQIVESQGGRIWIESPPSGGTAVHFTVPA